MEKRTAGEAIHSGSTYSRIIECRWIIDRRAAIAADDIVTRVSGVRQVVNPELRMVEHIERLGAEFEIPLAEDFEMFQQGNIEIRAPWIVERISPAISKSQTAWSDEGRRIVEQGSNTLHIVSPDRLPIIGVSHAVCV